MIAKHRTPGPAAPRHRLRPLRAGLAAAFVAAGVGLLVVATATSDARTASVPPTSGATGGTSAAVHSYTAHRLVPPGSCVGAAALTAPVSRCSFSYTGPVTPTPAKAALDRSDAYPTVAGGSDCFSHAPSFPVITCTRGVAAGRIRVALIGNSHAGHWLPALESIARIYGWRITTYLASQCASSDIKQGLSTSAAIAGCSRWVESTTRAVVAAKYNLVVMSNRVSVGALGHDLAGSWSVYTQGYVKVLTAFHRAHLRVVALRDMPAPGAEKVPACIAAHLHDYAVCNGTRATWLPKQEPVAGAVAALHDVHIGYVDLTGRICLPTVCPAVIGGIIAYVDGSHMTATYNRTIAPFLAPHLRYALSRA
jgi:hypothetical protein